VPILILWRLLRLALIGIRHKPAAGKQQEEHDGFSHKPFPQVNYYTRSSPEKTSVAQNAREGSESMKARELAAFQKDSCCKILAPYRQVRRRGTFA
jgi:hypothetical protein